jgi:hypothetical protein
MLSGEDGCCKPAVFAEDIENRAVANPHVSFLGENPLPESIVARPENRSGHQPGQSLWRGISWLRVPSSFLFPHLIDGTEGRPPG